MTFTEKNLVRTAVSSLAEVVYTVSLGTTIVKDIHICNNSNVDCYISLWLVPNADNNTNENIMFHQWNVPGNDIAHWSGYQVLETIGDKIMVQSEVDNQITITISGAIIN